MDITKGPWAWRKLGGEHHLVRDEGTRPALLTAGVGDAGTDDEPRAVLLTRDATGRLVPVTPELPAMRLIASAPDLAAENARLRAVLRRLADAEEGRDDMFDVARAARAALGEGDADG
jgi:hypothetical protein